MASLRGRINEVARRLCALADDLDRHGQTMSSSVVRVGVEEITRLQNETEKSKVYDYDSAPTDPAHGGKMTAQQAADRIDELTVALRSLLHVHIETWAFATDRRDTLPDSRHEIAVARKVLGSDW